ncbi:hypothetical protein [Nocardioides sp. WS12]|uniref:hypothetical protein n=1 Tax=Nocardioides sp. WS12 TaxID=2486272 RepID=UPI0015F97CDE|nr:hypothetical protein [Nocardioides sp. WS12]
MTATPTVAARTLTSVGPSVAGGEPAAAPSPAISALGRVTDPTFNPATRANDLVRAIDSADYDIGFKQSGFLGGLERDVSKEKRKVDAAKVLVALDDLTPSQVGEVERRYNAWEKRTSLRKDLFEGGESGRPSNLSPDEQARIAILMKGTRPEPIPESVLAELATMPPEVAADIARSMVAEADKAAALNRLEGEAVELHSLLRGFPTNTKADQALAMHRVPVEHIVRRDALYEHRFGPIAEDLRRMTGTRRTRMDLLRGGDVAGADAMLLEQQAREIAKLDAADASADDSLFGAVGTEERRRTRNALTKEMMGLIEQNRLEALADPANATRSAGAAVTDRLSKLLQQRPGAGGESVGSMLARTLGKGNADAVAALGNTAKAGDSTALIEYEAARLVADEKARTTSAKKIIATLRSFRDLAKQDLIAAAQDPWVPVATKESIIADIDGAIDATTGRYIALYKSSYQGLRGMSGRSFDRIVASADDADEKLLGTLASGSGRAEDVAELEHAMGKRDVAKVKEILKRQPHGEAVAALIKAYNGPRGERDLKGELFGRNLDGAARTESQAAGIDKPGMFEIHAVSQGLVSGRDATLVGEQLAKPSSAALKESGGASEAAWLVGGGKAEHSATMANRGITGDLRAIGDDPETQRLLTDTRNRMLKLSKDLAVTRDPAAREALLLELRRARAALTGDAAAYEEDNERVRAQLQSAVSFAVSIALAIAIPGAGPGLVAFLQTAAINIAASVATNVVIKGDAYSLNDLKADLIGGALGAGGAKFGEELLGRVVGKVLAPSAKATGAAAEKFGMHTVLSREAAELASSAERAVVETAELEAKLAGQATAATGIGVASDAATAAGRRNAFLIGGAQEVGGFFGGIYGGKLPSGDLNLTVEELLQNLASTFAGKAGQRKPVKADAPGEHGGPRTHDDGTGSPAHEDGQQQRRAEGEALPHDTALPAGGEFIADPAPPSSDVFGPRSPKEMLQDGGMLEDTAKGFQAASDQLNVIIKVRRTNPDSLPVLEAGGVAKPSLVKSKTVDRVDGVIGGPVGGEGKVGFFEPRMPSEAILKALTPEARAAVEKRFTDRKREFETMSAYYGDLTAQGVARVKDGVVQVVDPLRPGADGEGSAFKDIGGDHDLYQITGPTGEDLTDAQRMAVVKQLQTMGINVLHPDHVNWKKDSPETHDPEQDQRIRDKHATEEPLLAFVPRLGHVEVFAGEVVTGPDRTEGTKDRFMPAESVTEVPGVNEYGGRTDEIDFSVPPKPGVAERQGDPDRSAIRVEGLPDDFTSEEPTRPDIKASALDDFSSEEPTRPDIKVRSLDKDAYEKVSDAAKVELHGDLANKPRKDPATGHPEGLVFGLLDLVYGPSAGGKLRELSNQAGGRLLNDVAESTVFPNFMAKSKAALDWARNSGGIVHFDLSHIPDVAGALAGTGPKADSVTSFELRYVRDHWAGDPGFRGRVHFYLHGKRLDRPPWETP